MWAVGIGNIKASAVVADVKSLCSSLFATCMSSAFDTAILGRETR